jgi:hypothetical protein
MPIGRYVVEYECVCEADDAAGGELPLHVPN